MMSIGHTVYHMLVYFLSTYYPEHGEENQNHAPLPAGDF